LLFGIILDETAYAEKLGEARYSSYIYRVNMSYIFAM